MGAVAKPLERRVRFAITFTLDVEDPYPATLDELDEDSLIVEEAITALIDEELHAHEAGSKRAGVRFLDALNITARREP